MVVRWITSGYLSDPFDEFMVKESGHITKGVLESDYTDEYWERRYTVRQTSYLEQRPFSDELPQLRDGSSLASSSKVASAKATPSLSAGIPPPRPGTTRLPGGACIPAFLQPWKHKILLAGKYLNVIRECGIEVKRPGELEETEGMVMMNEPKWVTRIAPLLQSLW
jgi:gamma-tubulin complex component 2